MHSVTVQVFWRNDLERLQHVAPGRWERFCRGLTPLAADAARPGRIDLLALTLRDTHCEVIDPISVIVDDNGFLYRPDLRLQPLPSAPQLFDARAIFLNRYLSHAHRWTPSDAIIEQALRMVCLGVSTVTD
jgi:hypothetical protein